MQPPELPGTTPRILCVRLDNTGDVVLTGPAARAIRMAYPGARIDLLTSRAGAAATRLLPWYDSAITARVAWQDASGDLAQDPGRELGLISSIAARRYDAAVIFRSFSQTPWPVAYALYLAGIPIRVAHATDFGGSVLSHVVPPPPSPVHEADRDNHLVTAMGIPVAEPGLAIAVDESARDDAAGLLGVPRAHDAPGPAGTDDRPVLLVAPGASCSSRRLDASAAVTAAGAIARRAGMRVVVTGTAREAELSGVVAAGSAGLDLAGRTELPVLAALVERAALVLTGNSLVMHLADALRRPVVVLYSGTDLPEHWRPRFTSHVLLQREVACAPCHLFDCPIGRPCLDVPTGEVVEAGLRLLGTEMLRRVVVPGRPVGRAMTGDEAAQRWPGIERSRAWTAFAS